jgi:hypothetical protein
MPSIETRAEDIGECKMKGCAGRIQRTVGTWAGPENAPEPTCDKCGAEYPDPRLKAQPVE